MTKSWLFGALAAGAVFASACSDDERPKGAAPDPSEGGADAAGATGGSAAGKAGSGGTNGGGDSNSNDAGHAGAEPVGAGGEGGVASGGAGTAGALSSMGGTPDPIPPVGPTPLCTQGAAFAAGTLVALSGSGDDLLQSITPDELTIAWKNGDDYFVADRSDPSAAFGAPLQVAGGASFLAVSLRGDGRLLLAITEEQSVVQISRLEGEAFDAATAVEGDFEAFNSTLSGSPEPGKVLTDAVLNAGDDSFYYSYFLLNDDRNKATVFESRRDAGAWTFGGLELGTPLHGTPSARRIPTGVSSDNLTLFYRDEVEGDFRAAWRVNTQVPYGHTEALALGSNTQAAAPNADCAKLYYSAQGASDLDLFVATRQ